MIMYKVRFSDYKQGTIKIEQYEIKKETEKMYILMDNGRINKNSLDVVDDNSFGYTMWTLNVNIPQYKERVTKVLKKEYEKYMKQAENVSTAIQVLNSCSNIKYVD